MALVLIRQHILLKQLYDNYIKSLAIYGPIDMGYYAFRSIQDIGEKAMLLKQ